MMNIFKYQEREKHRQKYCERCGRFYAHEQLAPHHIYLRSYADECVWLCWKCHSWVHANPAEAREEGFLRHHNIKDERMTKKKKKKSCKHIKTYYDNNRGDYVCMSCGKVIGEFRSHFKSKKSKPKKKKKCNHGASVVRDGQWVCQFCGKPTSGAKKKSKKRKGMSSPKVKMGTEPQDPRIAKAEMLKRERAYAKRKARGCAENTEEWKRWKDKAAKLTKQMKDLQETYEG